MILDGCPGLSKHKVLRLVAGLLPKARAFSDVNCDDVLLSRSLLECRNPCCFDYFHSEFLSRRLRKDLQIKPRAGVTLRVRDTFSCANFSEPYRLAASSTWFPRKNRIYSRKMVPKFCLDSKAQKCAEAEVKSRRGSAKRVVILLRPDNRKTAVECFLNQHEPQRRKELAAAADSFVRLLDLAQMSRADRKPHRVVRHDPSNPKLAAETVADIVRSECKKLNIPL